MAKKTYTANHRIRGLVEAGKDVELEPEQAEQYLKSGILSEKQAEKKQAKTARKQAKASDKIGDDFPGATALKGKFKTYGDVAQASDEQLAEVDGVGPVTIEEARAALTELGIATGQTGAE